MQYIYNHKLDTIKPNTLAQLHYVMYQPAGQILTSSTAHTSMTSKQKNYRKHIIALLSKKTRSYKTWLQVASLFVLCLPTKSLTNFQSVDRLERITTSNLLTVAMTNDQMFIDDEHMHSFELDSAQRYAKHLGAKLSIKSFDSEEAAKLAVSHGLADMFIGKEANNLSTIKLSCDTVNLSDYGLDSTLSFAFHPKENSLFNHAKDYLCQKDTLASTTKMAKFYQANFLDTYSEKHFERAISERLPNYQAIFQAQANKYNHDWELLVAISYQESHLNPNAISRTGVQGLMMLTNDTAALMGVKDRTDPIESIQGGAKYLKKLNKRFEDIPQSERLWFVLSAYNMGPNTVRSIQKELKATGKDPNSWSHFYSYLADNGKENSRYIQCMHYVTNIRHYFELLKGETLAQKTPHTSQTDKNTKNTQASIL